MAKMNKEKKSQESGDAGGGWEIVYSGFVLILLCFFIMLSSFASIEEGRVTRFVKSFIVSISMLDGGLGFTHGERILPASPDIVDKESELGTVYDTLQQTADKLKETVEELRMKNGLDVSMTPRGIVLRLSDTILFRSGQADILPAALPLLDGVGSVLSGTSHLVRVEGHTDNRPIHTERFPSNWELSTVRAVNVLRYFLAKGYVASGKISAEGFAEYRPFLPNILPGNRALNRRVEILISDNEKK